MKSLEMAGSIRSYFRDRDHKGAAGNHVRGMVFC
jgi:hypothetical protein